MQVRESFVGELAAMGDGLQIWLQCLLFIAENSADDFVVLDEPDVYLHPDMQRKITRLVQTRFSQSVIATHSIEIMSEYLADQIVVVSKSRAHLRPMGDSDLISNLLSHLGSSHNLTLARLATTKKCLLVEGNDMEYLNAFHGTLYPEAISPLRHIPNWPFEGKGNWQQAVGASKSFQAGGDKAATIKVYCILDGDYAIPEVRSKLMESAIAQDVNLAILDHKEIENYLLVPNAILRYLMSRRRKGKPAIEDILTQLEDITDGLKEGLIGSYVDAIKNWKPQWDGAKLYLTAKDFVSSRWETLEDRLSICPGKEVLSQLSAWSQASYGTMLSRVRLAQEVRKSEIPSDLKHIIQSIHRGRDF
jgi:energy-coupling factor transporter ATP-binding protein EcfA2